MASKNTRPEASAEEAAARELVRLASEPGLSLTGPDGLLKQLTKQVLETALSEELTSTSGTKSMALRQAGTCETAPARRPSSLRAEGTCRSRCPATAREASSRRLNRLGFSAVPIRVAALG